jgi:hypothetical protein
MENNINGAGYNTDIKDVNVTESDEELETVLSECEEYDESDAVVEQ